MMNWSRSSNEARFVDLIRGGRGKTASDRARPGEASSEARQ